jgi:small redox-active disulfide protein 2
MKTLQILGAGCPKCATLAEITEQAAREMGFEYRLEKVTDIQKIISFNVLMTPALVVDGVVKVAGRVPSLDEIKKMLS